VANRFQTQHTVPYNKSIFPRPDQIVAGSKGGMNEIKETVQRVSLDTLYQVTFSFGKFQNWLEGFGDRDGFKRTQGRGFREKMSIMCTEAEIPGTSFQTSLAVGHHQGIQEEFPNLRTFPPLNLVFYVDADHVVLEILESWMTYINPLSTAKRNVNAYGRFNYPETYKEILHVTKFENDFLVNEIDEERILNTESDTVAEKIEIRKPTTKLLTYEFINVWPTNLTSMRVAYGNSNVLRCSVQFAYDRYFTDYNYDQAHGIVLDDGTGENIPVTTQIGKNLPSNPQGFSGYTER
tara:strand:+ start:45 stop:923 length:879 start_codon:yes stop_codon:yes gene_type:complete